MLSDLQLVYMVPRNYTQLLKINTTKFQVEREPVYEYSECCCQRGRASTGDTDPFCKIYEALVLVDYLAELHEEHNAKVKLSTAKHA